MHIVCIYIMCDEILEFILSVKFFLEIQTKICTGEIMWCLGIASK